MNFDNSPKKLLFKADARAELLKGVKQLADAVSITMGPGGQTVVIDQGDDHWPILTKDGVTVAKEVELENKLENVGAQMVREVASKTSDVAGDGTTTATVLAQSIVNEGLKNVTAGANPMSIKRGIDAARDAVVDAIKKQSKDLPDSQQIAQVATISANDDKEVGDKIAEAMEKVGKDGVITVEESKTAETFLETVEGMQFDRGYLSPYFITNHEKSLCELDNPYIVLVNKALSSVKEILPVLEKLHNESRAALIIADEVEGEALQALSVNKLKGVLNICAIKAPEFGDARIQTFDDLSVLTGTEVINAASFEGENGISNIKLGVCRKAIISKGGTILLGCASQEELEDRVQSLRNSLQSPANSEPEKEILRRRIFRLSGGIAVLRVGGSTEIELAEKKDRVDDALHATQAAISEGIVPGGGSALIRAAKSAQKLVQKKNESYDCGVRIMLNACSAPLKQIALNAGAPADIVVEKVRKLKGNMGYNARTECYEDLVSKGVIDPSKVVKSAVNHAAVAACNLLSVGCAMTIDSSIEENNF